MTRMKTRLLRAVLVALVGVGALFASDRTLPTSPGSFVTEANAIIGRPLTPMSYAGVARRTTGRAVGAGAAVGAAAVGAAAVGAAVAPRCVQVADAYGRIVTQCN
jgi:hypothetical protein